MARFVFRRLCLLAAVLSGSFFFLPSSRAAEEDAGDIEILRAFQERFSTSKGWFCDWRDYTLEGVNSTNPAWPNPNWPSENDFTPAQIETLITRIFNYLSRYPYATNPGSTLPTNVPLFYLTGEWY